MGLLGTRDCSGRNSSPRRPGTRPTGSTVSRPGAATPGTVPPRRRQEKDTIPVPARTPDDARVTWDNRVDGFVRARTGAIGFPIHD